MLILISAAKEEAMPRKVVIKIKVPEGVLDFTAPYDIATGNWYCCAMPGDLPRAKVRASKAKSMREVLDGLERMYEDLYGGE